jgi:gliding motility-associated-like protein
MNNLQFLLKITLFISTLFSAIVLKSNPVHGNPPPFLANKNFNSVLATAPILVATGNQIHCPGGSTNIVTSMSITHDPTEIGTNAIYIQISSGYVNGQDLLTLTGTHPNITGSWNQSNGKLTLQNPTGGIVPYNDFVNAIEDVVYSNDTTNTSGTRTFSITVGQANYLPSNGHYYQYVPSLGISWTNAKTAAETSTYYGLQGYLATITAMDEAILIGEQASGTGWISGTDQETEGIWKWASGPEIGQIFWNGGANGSSPTFAYWNNGEPNNTGNNEDYAHITAPGVGIPGSWNDLTINGESNGNYQPKGYIVEYGGTTGDPILQISTSTTIFIPKITTTVASSRCGSGVVILTANASAGTVTWYDSPSGGTPLSSGNIFTTPILNETTSYYVDAFDNQCPSVIRTEIIATVYEIPIITSTTAGENCGTGSVNLQALSSVGTIQWFANQAGGNALGSGNSFTTPSISATTTFYAEAFNNGCSDGIRTPVIATIFPVPNTDDIVISLCQNDSVQLNSGISNVSYEWSTGETSSNITVQNAGNYSVTMTTTDGCAFTKNFTINQLLAPEISAVIVNGTSVKITTLAPGSYQYSIDGINFQDSNIFTNVTSGLHTATVINSCDSNSQTFVVVIVPKFFSPNQDSFNDFWKIEGMSFYPEAKVVIFDRYGKLITQLSQSNPVWDGTFNGRRLPATDYCYVLKINNLLPEIKGHFALIR